MPLNAGINVQFIIEAPTFDQMSVGRLVQINHPAKSLSRGFRSLMCGGKSALFPSMHNIAYSKLNVIIIPKIPLVK